MTDGNGKLTKLCIVFGGCLRTILFLSSCQGQRGTDVCSNGDSEGRAKDQKGTTSVRPYSGMKLEEWWS